MGQVLDLDAKIYKIISHVFRRPYLSVLPDTPFPQLATYLATGHQVLVDGLIVAEDRKLIGMIGGKEILEFLVSSANSNNNDFMRITASDIMISDASAVNIDSSLDDLLSLFEKTKFGFAPITIKDSLIGSIGIRDLLPLILEANLSTPIKEIESPVCRLGGDETLKNSIESMLKNRIRNLVFPGSDYPHNRNADFIINDRKVLEFIFSYEGKKIISGEDWPTPLDRIKVNSLDMIPASYVSQSETVSKAAKLLSSIYTPALLSENNIITPWDIVMKTIRRDFSSRS
ncbi:MAG TPA: CBS domain-containing protein [Nitrososphaeraceae archaeon]|jgi:predicted transcriptional regulator